KVNDEDIYLIDIDGLSGIDLLLADHVEVERSRILVQLGEYMAIFGTIHSIIRIESILVIRAVYPQSIGMQRHGYEGMHPSINGTERMPGGIVCPGIVIINIPGSKYAILTDLVYSKESEPAIEFGIRILLHQAVQVHIFLANKH